LPYQNKWEHKGIRRVFTNKTSGKEIFWANLDLQKDSRFDDVNYVINDFTKLVDFEVSETEVDMITGSDDAASIKNTNIKIAIVATLEPFLVWVELYLEMMRNSPFECKVFSNVNDAYKWISG